MKYRVIKNCICIFLIFLMSMKNTMSLKKKLMFTCLDKRKLISVSVKRKGVIYLNKKFINSLIYTKEDEIYKINDLKESYKLRGDDILENKDRHIPKEHRNNIISNSLCDKLSDLESAKYEDGENGENNLARSSSLSNEFTPSDYELRLYKNKCMIPIYWIKKLEKLKNINAINCIEYLKGDNLLYFDNYKNKGLLKFLNDEKKKYSNCIILSRVGDFYETYGLDSIFLIEFLNIKKMNNKLSCGFIKSSINKALSILTNNNLNVCIYEEINEQSLKAKKRYLSQIVTPEMPIYLNNIQYCLENDQNKDGVDEENSNNTFANSYDLDNNLNIKEIVCIYIEGKNIFSLSKINLSLKTISLYDNITFDVLNVYLKNTNFLKAYIHQHNNTTFTKKITELFKIENYYLFNNFNNSFEFHMFILDKLKKHINISGLFRVIKNKNIFNISKEDKNGESDKKELENNFDYSFSSYCTPLNIFTSYNMGLYKQNNCYENRNNFLFYNIIDVKNKNSNSINIAESLEFFKNLFIFYPPFSVTKHIRYINEYIQKNVDTLIISNVRPFKNNIIITLLSNFKADHIILKKILSNVLAVHKCMNTYDYSFLSSLFHVLNHQNSFKLNIIKFYNLLENIKKILTTNLYLSNSQFSYNSKLTAFNEFVLYHESETSNIINENLLTEQNEDLEKNRNALLQSILTQYGEINERTEEYNIELLNKVLKIDNPNGIIGVKRGKGGLEKNKNNNKTGKAEKSDNNNESHIFFHPLNKKGDIMKNIFVTDDVLKKIKLYFASINRKKKKINEIIKNINMNLASSVHILSFVSNFLQIVQAFYNHTINSMNRGWNLPLCKHLNVKYETKHFQTVEEKLKFIQRHMYSTYKENEQTHQVTQGEEKIEQLDDDNFFSTSSKLKDEENNKILENIDKNVKEEIKKIYNNKNYTNDSLTYIMGLKPYNMNKDNVTKYNVLLKKKKFILLTGENMSGKTTLSFTIMCILFLANLGMYAPCDKGSIIGKFREFYSLKNINYQEQIENMSLFREQTHYINSIIEEIKENYSMNKTNSRDEEIFILFDEPCIATTPLDNAVIISAVAEYLKNYCGIIISHNYDLLNKIYQSENIEFKKINDNVNYLRDQPNECVLTLEDGICKSSQALETCKYTNTDSNVLKLLKMYEKKYKLIYNLSNTLYYKFLKYLKDKKENKVDLNNFFDNFYESYKNGKHNTNTENDNEDGQARNCEYVTDIFNFNEINEIISRENINGDTSRSNKFELDENDYNSYMVKENNLDESESEKIRESPTMCKGINLININNDEFYEFEKYYESEIQIAINMIENFMGKKIMYVRMDEDVPIFFKNKSIVYILCIFENAKNVEKKKPYLYIGISDNISERIKYHTKNLLKNKSLLRNEKKNNILNYKYNMTQFYTLLFNVENKNIAAKYEKELTEFLKNSYDIISK
ncbi:DNA mismatch repair protein, putative [Plasmodium vinckei lentum]|uniref:DNA mismatch repair protein, putative n=1 Tax=Plasmodium vinckei lentum TaxID=138297 RepID=A0A6V7S819_PLAVN|nr:DNA mismatch repair protein, putative [Plasmodium vinckei lentum]